MLSREELGLMRQQQATRERLFALADTKPMNVKRKSTKSPSRSVPNKLTHKLSIQDFVRSDPSYTPNIEHLVFPDKGIKGSPVKGGSVIGIRGGGSMDGGGRESRSSYGGGIAGKTRSRLAEMFALSRHLQQRSADRDSSSNSSFFRKSQPILNRSVDSSLQPSSRLQSSPSTSSGQSQSAIRQQRWIASSSANHATSNVTTSAASVAAAATANVLSRQSATAAISPQQTAVKDSTQTQLEQLNDMATARGPNISILHLRSTSETWDKSPSKSYPNVITGSSRSYPSSKGQNPSKGLTKHQSLTNPSPFNSQNQNQTQNQSHSKLQRNRTEDNFYSTSRINSQKELYVSGMCSRELSPVRWCDQEVDGVYLGRSGWVQVQQRSLDDRKTQKNTAGSLPQYKKTGFKLADYHCNSEPSTEIQRPAYLPLKPPESFSPPPITPIISPPPAFQDRVKPVVKSKARLVYGKPPFLPRSDAIVDSDIISPPTSPTPSHAWGLAVQEARPIRRKLTPSPVSGASYNPRIPQTKSLEEATNRRSQFSQRYKESSSSSSSSLGFRSLDSCVSRPVMPRLAEVNSRSVDLYSDADEEDNNSSSLNLSNVSSSILPHSPSISPSLLRDPTNPNRDYPQKTSPNTRKLLHYRSNPNPSTSHRSPNSSDGKQICSSPSSSSSSNSGFPIRSPINMHNLRRSTPNRQNINRTQEEQRVRRSRSLQLPEKRSPGSIPYQNNREIIRETQNQNIQRISPINLRNSSGSKLGSIERNRALLAEELLEENRVKKNREYQDKGSLRNEFPKDFEDKINSKGNREFSKDFDFGSDDSRKNRVLNEYSREFENPNRNRLPNEFTKDFPKEFDFGSDDSRKNNPNRNRIPNEFQKDFDFGPEDPRIYPKENRITNEFSREFDFGSDDSRKNSKVNRVSNEFQIPQEFEDPRFSSKGTRPSNEFPRDFDDRKKIKNDPRYGSIDRRVPLGEIDFRIPVSNSKMEFNEDLLREAEVVTEFLYGSRNRAAAKALLMQRFYYRETSKGPENPERVQNGMGRNNTKPLVRGSTTGSFTPSPTSEKNPCNSITCDFWPHCAQRETLNQYKVSPSYPRSPQSDQSRTRDSTPEPMKKRVSPLGRKDSRRTPTPSELSRQDRDRDRDDSELFVRDFRRPRDPSMERKPSPQSKSRSPSAHGNSSASSSSSDIWVTTSDRTVTKSPRNFVSVSLNKSSNASTPLEDNVPSIKSEISGVDISGSGIFSAGLGVGLSGIQTREMILTRPGSAPVNVEEEKARIEFQKRSMSLPKSFLSGKSKQGGQFPYKRQESRSGLTPSPRHRPPTPEIAHTAPVTPQHEVSEEKRRSGKNKSSSRRAKASSTPHLLDQPDQVNWTEKYTRKWSDKSSGEIVTAKDVGGQDQGSGTQNSNNRIQHSESHRNVSGNTAESVLQKFRKTFSLRFQKKGSSNALGSKESCSSAELGDLGYGDPSEEESPQHHSTTPTQSYNDITKENSDRDGTEQKYKFGPLVWRSSKERKKSSKASRNAKCNSGDSGIQIEMVSSGCGGILEGGLEGGVTGGGSGGASSESHAGDTDPPGDGDDTDSPPLVRRRPTATKEQKHNQRPQSELIQQILIDKFKADLQSRSQKHQHVRRTHSDLGGQRLLQWESRKSYRRMMSTPSPLKSRQVQGRLSPRRKPPDAPGGVQLRGNLFRRNGRQQLRRSLSQPIDIDKLSPLMRNKSTGARLGNNVLSEDEHDGHLNTSDDEAMSDSESSLPSLGERKKSLELPVDDEMIILAEAVFDHVAIEAEELAFRAGDVIEVLETVNRDWWWGSTGGRSGWFPAAFVRLRVSQEDTVEDCLAAMASGKKPGKTLRRRTSISLLSNEQVRTSVVRELVHTERDFVKILTDVVEGYITECRRRKDMFTPEQIQTIFINLEEMLKFQSQFLKDLESCINWDAPHKSCVGNCFLTHRSGFRMYSDYCNHHPMATATLQELYQFNNYSKFFEACRLMRGLIEIPLDGYLLTPVQRICKYPLQLAELLKYTKTDHPDYENIKEALKVMKDVAVLINERKRRMESLEKIAAWQQRVEGWEGEDLIEVSSQLIHQGEVVRVTSGMWTSNITLFLFDHQLIYCKKDILKRNTYVYKGRISLDTSDITDMPDGKDPQLGVNVRHGIKVYSCVRDKYLLFCCRSANDKQKWLDSFAQERKSVSEDRDVGLEFAPAARKLARLAARCQRRPPSKPRVLNVPGQVEKFLFDIFRSGKS